MALHESIHRIQHAGVEPSQTLRETAAEQSVDGSPYEPLAAGAHPLVERDESVDRLHS
jgi:hypothetical protein